MLNQNKGQKLVKETFDVEVKYSDEAIEKKLIKFIVKEGNEIVLSSDEILSILVGQVNSETLSAAFVESERVNVVEVVRQIQCILDRDYKKGEIININYGHPYPIEFAIIEEVWKIAQIKKNAPVTELTSEMIENVRKEIKPQQVEFLRKFYKSFKKINTDKNMDEIKNEDVVTGEEIIAEEVVEETPEEEVTPEAVSDEQVAETPAEEPAE